MRPLQETSAVRKAATADQRYQVISLRAVGNQVFAGGLAAHVVPGAANQAIALKQP